MLCIDFNFCFNYVKILKKTNQSEADVNWEGEWNL